MFQSIYTKKYGGGINVSKIAWPLNLCLQKGVGRPENVSSFGRQPWNQDDCTAREMRCDTR